MSKTMRRICMNMMLCTLACATMSAQGIKEQPVEKVETRLLESVVPKELPNAESMVINRDDYYGQVIEGYYHFDCVVSKDLTRKAKFYIPHGTVYNQPTVFVMVPSGEDPYLFLVQSGWKAVSDKELLSIVLMEDDGNGWGEDDVSYINELNIDVSYRPFFCAFSSSFYGVAYGPDASSSLMKHGMLNPKSWAGIALVGTDGVAADLVRQAQSTDSRVPGIKQSEVEMPVWIVSESRSEAVGRLIDFYRAANHSMLIPEQVEFADELYRPRRGGTDDNQWCANVLYSEKDWKTCLDAQFAEDVYRKAFQGVYRYPGDANGALRRNDDIFVRGFEKFEKKVPGGMQADGSDLYTREWYVYVGKRVDRTKAAPLVFVFHGAGGSGNEIADRSGWAQVADDRGLIIVMPTGSHIRKVREVSNIRTNELFRAMWNVSGATEERPSDLLFVRYLYQWMCEHYLIDQNKVYASGQSSGGMMSWACARDLGDIFVAVAPISANGTLTAVPVPDVDDPKVAIIGFIGELDTTFKGGFGGEAAHETIDYWTRRNGCVHGWDAYTYMDGGKNCTCKGDLFTNYVYENAQGVPMVRAVEVATKTHAIWPSECYVAWDECFSHFTKDKVSGKLFFDGKEVK